MPKKARSKGRRSGQMLPVLHAEAAGIDIGAEEIFVAVPADRAVNPVRSFETFTRDLNELADWLQECGVRTVAMESTGVYWIPLYQILEGRGFKCSWSMRNTSKTCQAARVTYRIASGFSICIP